MDSRNWPGLPDLVPHLILHNLYSLSDCLCFGAVCKPWFSFLSNNYGARSIEEPPLLMFCTDREQYTINTSLYNAAKSKIISDLKIPMSESSRCCGSSNDWLAFQEFDSLIRLFNPFSHEIVSLPPLKSFVHKVIITKTTSTYPYNFKVAAMTKRVGDRIVELAFLKPDSYAWIFPHSDVGVCDMIYYNERYYIVTYTGKILSIDNTTLELNLIIGEPSIRYPCTSIKFYLVKTTTNELLRVQIVFPRDKPSSVEISKLVASPETQEPMLAELDNLGDEALFLCNHSSMSVLASKFSGCIANFVYYLDSDARLELPGNQYIMDINHLQYGRGLQTHFSLRASIDGNALALWIVPTPRFTSTS